MSARCRRFARRAVAVGALAMCLSPAHAPAQQAAPSEPPVAPPQEGRPAVEVIVVDMQAVRRQSTAVDHVQRQIQARRDAYEAELQELERRLQQDRQSLLERRSEMSAEDYNAEIQELDRRLQDAQRDMRATKASLDRLYTRGMLEVDRAIVQVAEEIATARGASLVLPKSAVLLVRSELEVTDQVIARLNDRLPRVHMPTPGPRP
jgi:Skp family chaperone for outer membrane proteins